MNSELIIPDVQGSLDTRKVPIQKVGIKSIRHPIIVGDNNKKYQSISNTNMYVNLSATEKGTHMSRFIEIIEKMPIVNIDSLKGILDEITRKLNSNHAFIELDLPIFLNKKAPISEIESMLDYGLKYSAKKIDSIYEVWQELLIPVTSLCPCSKKISKYGAHNQRSHIIVKTIQYCHEDFLSIISAVESQASSELFGVLKRPDEKYVTERAYNNPKFVEDLVRDVALSIYNIPNVISCEVSSENFESIHNHSAYAVVCMDKRK